MIRDLLESGLRLPRAGRMEDAKLLCQQILESQPGHPDALHLPGWVALQSGRADGTVALLKRAIRTQRRNPAFHADLALLALMSNSSKYNGCTGANP
ncbi:MAG: tetratricopeptide repeat protein [Burkholderiales bacterium]